MSYDFKHRVEQSLNFFISKARLYLSTEEEKRIGKINIAWNFYEGFHWEGVVDNDAPQVTINYCKRFVNKFVAFELGKGMVIKMLPAIEDIKQDNPLNFLNNVWKINKVFELLTEFGQAKSVTGDGFLFATYEAKYIDGELNPAFEDPFGEFDNGRIRITVVPSVISFPEYDPSDKNKMTKFKIMYLKKVENSSRFFKGENVRLYRMEWTKDKVEEYLGEELISSKPNKYKVIPFAHIRNYPLQGKISGISDLDDIIPINMEYNLKKSNMSEIIDYHSAPITVVFGARIAGLERGANKVWGGLPKDAKVENLKLEGELDAAQTYMDSLKTELLEVAGIPVGSLGGDLKISNTSAIALQIALMPLLENIEAKQNLDKEGIAYFNKIILKIALDEGLLKIPEGITNKDFYFNEIMFNTVLPKDLISELQQIDAERKMLLTTREQALKRLGRDNIQERINDVNKEMKEIPEFYALQLSENKEGDDKKLNAGYTNSPYKK